MKARSRFNEMSIAAGIWSELIVGGHPCYAYVPPEPSPHGGTVMYLHGVHLGRLDERPAFARLFDRYGLRCIAPVTQRSWWTDRICTEFDPGVSAERHVLDRVLPWLAEHWSVTPPRIALFGTSMGGQGALRLAYKHPNVFPIAAAISPAIDYQMRMEDGDPTLDQMYRDEEQARQDTATLHIHPLNWPRHQWFCCDPVDYRWHESAERLRSKLYSLGVPHMCDLETSGGGHSWEYYERMAEPAFRFIVDALERERLRV
jgi:pimeloyl-ACP methyl ester carboxylesterase